MQPGGILVQNPFWVVTENRLTELHEILVGLCTVVVVNFWLFENFRKIQDGRQPLSDSFVTLSNRKAIFSYSLNWIFLKLGTHVHWVRAHSARWADLSISG